eukprot:jgi/Psemu1/222269/e_gw1.1202.14.1
MHALMDGWMDGCIDGWRDGWMNECTCGSHPSVMMHDGWMDGWMDKCDIHSSCIPNSVQQRADSRIEARRDETRQTTNHGYRVLQNVCILRVR